MATHEEIMEAARAMVMLSDASRKAGLGLQSRYEEARAALEAAERVRAEWQLKNSDDQ